MPSTPLARVCCVEDDEDIQRILQLSLERIGKLTVEMVADPASAISRMIEFKPDLVVLDWMMPGLDGPTLYRAMREQPQTRNLPVVFITAKASARELNELRALGAAGAISKPFSPKDLPEQLRAIWNALPDAAQV
jgi:CheY-like chemotaxis protein